MTIGGHHPKSKSRSNVWMTLDEIYDPIFAAAGGITFDLAASDHNHRAPFYLTESEDALSISWDFESLLRAARVSDRFGSTGYLNRNCWLNAPWDNLLLWSQKCREGQLNGLTIYSLLPPNVCQMWFRDWCLPFAERHWYRGWDDGTKQGRLKKSTQRVQFNDPSGEGRTDNTKGSLLAIFRPPMPDCWIRG